MSTLRLALDELRGVDLRHLSDEELEDGLQELERAAGLIEAERARWVAEIERRGTFAREGHLSVTSWVADRFRTGWSDASKRVRLARALEHMPATKEALAEGEVSRSAVDQMVRAFEASPEDFSRVEETFVDTARALPVRDLRKAVGHWKEMVDQERCARDAEERYTRRASVSPPRSRGWSGWTGTWTPRPARP